MNVHIVGAIAAIVRGWVDITKALPDAADWLEKGYLYLVQQGKLTGYTSRTARLQSDCGVSAMTALLLTVPEAAERLRVGVRTLNRLHQQRALPYVRIGGQIRFPVDALDRWIAAQIVYPESGNRAGQPEDVCTERKVAPTGRSPTATPAGARLNNLLLQPI